ncbi:MAG: tetratricopeptide repeat protein, partial [Chloroflexi bacterium]|nr:tetratricopeptide repeat protein [Chloroflexota bacterium]
SVFAGGWTLAAVEAVCGEKEEGFDLLSRLVDKSLVMVQELADHTRYNMLETIRQYAREKLLASGEGEALRQRHLAYYLQLGEEGDQKLQGGEQIAWLKRLGEELENFRAAIQWSLGAPPGSALPQLGVQLNWALFLYWGHTGSTLEGGRYCESFLALPTGQEQTAARALALLGAQWLGGRGSDTTYIDESIALFRQVGDRRGLAWALAHLGLIEGTRRLNYPRAETLLAESDGLFQALGDRGGLANVRGGQALTAMSQGDYARARALQQEGAALYQSLGDRINYGATASHMGLVDLREGDYVAARAHFAERVAISREGGGAHNIRTGLLFLGTAILFQGDYQEALAIFTESLALVQQMGLRWYNLEMVSMGEAYRLLGNKQEAVRLFGESLPLPVRDGNDRWSVIVCLRGLAGLALAAGDGMRAARLLGAAEGIQSATGIGVGLPAGVTYQQDRAAARAHLGEAAFEAAWAAGQAMSLEQAVAYALEEASPQ